MNPLNLCLGLLAIGASIRPDSGRRGGWRFGYAALFFSLLAWRYPFWTLRYLALAAGLLFLVEYHWGRINRVPLWTLVAMMPVLEFLAEIFSFPIRLALTGWVGRLLSFSGDRVVAEGNTIVFNGTEFSVDPACMGLHMLVASLLAGLMLVGHFQRVEKKELGAMELAGICLLVLPLDVLSNLFRMLGLVYFRILPESALHGAVGLVCFGAYVLAPLAVAVKWVVGKWGRAEHGVSGSTISRTPSRVAPRPPGQGAPQTSAPAGRWLVPLLFVLLSLLFPATPDRNTGAPAFSLNGFARRDMPDHITQLRNGRELVYLKPLPGFFSSEHHPMICWTGGGYTFQHVEIRRGIYTAILEKKTERLYTAWWYDNGTRATTSEAVWRWDMFCGGRPYALVNVTAAGAQTLDQAVAYFRSAAVRSRLFDKNLLNHADPSRLTR